MKSLELIYNLKNKIEAIMLSVQDDFAVKLNRLERMRYSDNRFYFKKYRMARLEKAMFERKFEEAVWQQIIENLSITAMMISEECDIVAALATLDEIKLKMARSFKVSRAFSLIPDVREIIDCFMEKPGKDIVKQLIVDGSDKKSVERRNGNV